MTKERILEIRNELALTQRQMADELGVVLHTYKGWEQGRKKIHGSAAKLAELRLKLKEQGIENIFG